MAPGADLNLLQIDRIVCATEAVMTPHLYENHKLFEDCPVVRFSISASSYVRCSVAVKTCSKQKSTFTLGVYSRGEFKREGRS